MRSTAHVLLLAPPASGPLTVVTMPLTYSSSRSKHTGQEGSSVLAAPTPPRTPLLLPAPAPGELQLAAASAAPHPAASASAAAALVPVLLGACGIAPPERMWRPGLVSGVARGAPPLLPPPLPPAAGGAHAATLPPACLPPLPPPPLPPLLARTLALLPTCACGGAAALGGVPRGGCAGAWLDEEGAGVRRPSGPTISTARTHTSRQTISGSRLENCGRMHGGAEDGKAGSAQRSRVGWEYRRWGPHTHAPCNAHDRTARPGITCTNSARTLRVADMQQHACLLLPGCTPLAARFRPAAVPGLLRKAGLVWCSVPLPASGSPLRAHLKQVCKPACLLMCQTAAQAQRYHACCWCACVCTCVCVLACLRVCA